MDQIARVVEQLVAERAQLRREIQSAHGRVAAIEAELRRFGITVKDEIGGTRWAVEPRGLPLTATEIERRVALERQ